MFDEWTHIVLIQSSFARSIHICMFNARFSFTSTGRSAAWANRGQQANSTIVSCFILTPLISNPIKVLHFRNDTTTNYLTMVYIGTTVWINPKNCKIYNTKMIITKRLSKLFIPKGIGTYLLTTHINTPKRMMLMIRFKRPNIIHILIYAVLFKYSTISVNFEASVTLNMAHPYFLHRHLLESSISIFARNRRGILIKSSLILNHYMLNS